MILKKTPLRISFFGGGTDLPEWFDKNDGSVISATIDKFTYSTLRKIPSFYNINYRLRYFKHEEVKNINRIKHNSIRETIKYFKLKGPIEISHNSDLVSQSGLGSSSSFTVGLVHAFGLSKMLKINKKFLSNTAIKIERSLLKESVGVQDQISCSYGGFNYIRFNKSDFKVIPISKKENVKKIEKSLIFIHCGIFRNANSIEKKKISKIKKGMNFSVMKKIDQLTLEAYNELNSSNFSLKTWGNYLNDYWYFKKQLDKSVSKKEIDEIHKKAMACGAYGGKLLGAGGGGFMMFICDQSSKKKIAKIFKHQILENVKFSYKGSDIVINNF
jgi:D-glycero-alpha-D-manno-heptose-7-phosphate kinase